MMAQAAVLPQRLADTALWHPHAQMALLRGREVVIVRGEGAYVWDEDRHRLLDAPASLWYCNVGHGRREIADAIIDQMSRLENYSTFNHYATRPALDLAERLAALVPIPNPKVFFTSGGSDAIETAAKLVRRYWNAVGRGEKQTIVARERAYHGLHGFGTSMAGLLSNRDGYGRLVEDIALVSTNDADDLELLVRERGAETIAAFFCEPVIGAGGVLPPAPGYLKSVERICKANDIIFVVDEVITGFGRTGAMFASERFGLAPDILVLAKGITSGYFPLGATVVCEKLWEPFWAKGSDLVFRHGVTYSGHATACAAAMANLDIIEQEGLVERVRSLEPFLDAGLRTLDEHDLVREVRSGIGLLAGIELESPATAEELARLCFDTGVLVRVITDGTLQISPPFIVTEDDLAMLVEVIEAALSRISDRSTETLLREQIS